MNQPSLPPLLLELIKTGRWKQPSDQQISHLIPFLKEPVDFLLSIEEMYRESLHLVSLVDDSKLSEIFHEYKGSTTSPRDLPWLDVEKTLFIAINRISGDDIAIALDYRTSLDNPRVVASDWWSEDNTKHFWKEVESQFSEFVKKLEF